MRFLLDTNVLLWIIGEPNRLNKTTMGTLRAPDAEIHVSAASVWEAAIKQAKRKLVLSFDLAAELRHGSATELAITSVHALRAARLPDHHSDPFDRMLVAQAQVENLTLVTGDRQIASYAVEILPASA